MNTKLGIAPINWSNDDDPTLGGGISFEQCIKDMADAGYCGTELGSKFPTDPLKLKQSLTEKGLELASGWFSTYFTEEDQYNRTLSRFMDKLSLLRASGARFINVCECGHAIQGTPLPVLSDQKPYFTEQQWQQLIQGLHAIGRVAHDFGTQIVYHYHAGTGVFHLNEIDTLMKHTSPELISLLLDTGHAALADINALDLIENHGSRIQYVHLKDVRMSVFKRVREENLSFMDAVRAGLFTVPGDGDLNFSAILSALNDRHYGGWMIVEAEQDPALAPPLVYAKKAMDYLTKMRPF